MKRKRTSGPATLAPVEALSTDFHDHASNTRKRLKALHTPRAQFRSRESVDNAQIPVPSRSSGSRRHTSSGARNRTVHPVNDRLSDSSDNEQVENSEENANEHPSSSKSYSASSGLSLDDQDADDDEGSTLSLDSQDVEDDQDGADSILSLDSQDAQDNVTSPHGADAERDRQYDSPDRTADPSTAASRQSSPSQRHPALQPPQEPTHLAEHATGSEQVGDTHLPMLLPRRKVVKKQQTAPLLAFEVYRDALERHLAKAWRIDTRTWALEVYNQSRKRVHRAVNEWTLVREMPRVAGPSRFTCSNCKDFNLFETCAHVQYVESDDARGLKCGSNTDFPLAHAFDWAPPKEGRNGVLMFACLTAGAQTDALVAWQGDATQDAWECSADPKVKDCQHIKNAKLTNLVHTLLQSSQKYSKDDFASSDEDEETATEDDDDDDEARAAEHERRERQSLQDKYDERSVSYKPVGPPPFCRIASDTERWYPTITPLPDYIELPDDARCVCGAPPDESAPKRVIMNAFIYSSFCTKQVQVEVQPCSKHPTSRGHLAGPDLRELGLFNFSNYSIFTHELLNSYTSRYFCHPAPFHGFCRTVRFEYLNHQSEHLFVGNNLFRSAWFSWTNVLQLFGTNATQSQSCPICGPEPATCIADAKTLGFQRHHLRSSLTPPTEVLAEAPTRDGVQPPPESTACVFGRPRQDAQRLCRWRASLTKIGKSKVRSVVGQLIENDAADVDADETGAVKQGKTRQKDRDKVDSANVSSMPGVIRALAAQSEPLANLFSKYVNTTWDKQQEPSRRPYYNLLQQVLAYESVLQLAPRSSWDGLGMLALGNKQCIDALLPEIPAFAIAAIEDQRHNGDKFSSDLRGLASFVRERAERVWRALTEGNNHDEILTPAVPPESVPDEWRETGQRYAGPRYRLRPSYPNLKHDNRADRSVVSEAGAGGIGCNKYYESYGKRDLTGGVFAIWCLHLICVGWHCIPRGEGRNDAFSALFTRWRKAPRVVIYDFACTLAPYCMLREPRFFKDTKFLIDDFHGKGHTRCTAACMLRTYRKHDASLSKTNSSAAECGNAGLNRIEKTVSFMSQRHAIIYTGVFLEIWNRTRTVHALAMARRLNKTFEEVIEDEALFPSRAE